MSHNEPDKVSFQVTVSRLTLPSPLPQQDIRVAVAVGDKSKITCSGEPSEDGLTIIWDHPFLFMASSSASVQFAIYALPELKPGWDREPLCEKMVANVASLLGSGDNWKFGVFGLPDGPGTLSVVGKESDVLTIPDGHDCLSSLCAYDGKLYKISRRFNNLPCFFTQIELKMAMLDFCPFEHPDHTFMLHSLSVSFHHYFNQGGNILYLNKAIEIEEIRLGLCPLGHPEHSAALGRLAFALRKYYKVQKNEAVLNRVIQLQERTLVLCPLGHPDHADALGGLGGSLSERYDIHENIADLNKSIEMKQKRLDLCPSGHSQHAHAIGALAISLWQRFGKLGDVDDLSRAIDLEEKKLKFRPPGHRKHGLALQNLALSLCDRYNITQDQADLTRAIQLFKKALTTHPPQHRYFARVSDALASAILHLHKSPQSDQSPPSLDEAFEVYQQLKKCAPAVSWDLLDAVKGWVRNAEEYDHSSVLEAYQTALNTLDHFTSLDSSLESRHESLQGSVADLANGAFSCGIRHGNLKMAVELLEQGRGILWSQLARFDISIIILEGRGDRECALGDKFTQLSADLREQAQGGGGSDAYWRVKDEWQSIVDEIRCLDGFSRFLLTPLFEDLQRAAERGPIIIVNASEYDCDALIVLRTGTPVHVPLPCTLPDIDLLCSQLSKLTQNPNAFGDKREFRVMEVLQELWSITVEPIVSVLRNDICLPLGSRIWWCPTSDFTKLPFHAAGPYRRGEKNMFDLYVSSYAPTLSAVIRTNDRIRVQEAGRDGSATGNSISFGAVGQRWPSAEMKLGELPEVEHEIERIQNETGIPREVEFNTVTGDGATINGAVQAFRDHRWVHLACHGSQHAEKPFESWFAMGDGKLTLMRIIQERYTNSEFAFLSACHTAVGDASTPDEVLHLAAGMQFAGFNGVIGTLWRVDDAVVHRVATQFYKEVFKQPVISFENAAAALNAAVLETADEVSLEKRMVFVHIGI